MYGSVVRLFVALVVALVGAPHPLFAQGTPEERLQRVEQEVSELKQGMGQNDSEDREGRGGKVAFYGYGELHYNHPVLEGTGFPGGGLSPTLDYHRVVLGWSYAFNDQLALHTEVEWEHAGGEIELEYAYLEYQVNDAVHVRVGSILLPVGPLNEFHEPANFYSVERPYTQRNIIPTTWQTGGVGLAGQALPGLKYRVYLVEGLDATLFSSSGIKESQQILSEDKNKAVNFGGVGRLEYTGLPGFATGVSYYSAGAAQGDPVIGHAHVTLWDVDLRYRVAGLDLTGLYAHTHIGGADRISAVVGEPIGSEQVGWYTEGAYHLGRLMGSSWDLVPFVRWEDIDTQSGIAASDRTPGTDRQVLTSGLAFYPHPDVAIKVDWERWKDETNDVASRWNLGLGYQF